MLFGLITLLNVDFSALKQFLEQLCVIFRLETNIRVFEFKSYILFVFQWIIFSSFVLFCQESI